MARKPKQPTVFDAYMNERVLYGGEEMTRADMIRELQTAARTWSDDHVQQQLLVGRYLQGHDRRAR